MGNVNITPPNHMNDWQNRLVFFTRIITSIPSLIGATYIVQHVIRSPKRRKRTSTRVLLGMSTMDLLLSITLFASTLIAPEGLRIYAIGNWATCDTFGFLGQGARLSSVIYNGSLTLYYLLTIRYGFKEKEMKPIEPWMHAVPLVIGWSTAIAGLPLTLYNPMPGGCEINSYPFGCPNTTPCLRGKNGDLYRMVFFLFPVWIVFFFLVVAMGMIYQWISKLEKANDQFRPERCFGTGSSNMNEHSATQQLSQSSSFSRSLSKLISASFASRKRNIQYKHAQQFAVQALLYCVAYAATWLFATIATVVRMWISGQTYYPLAYLNVALSSLQGFWNALIYVRPRYLRYRRMQRQLEEQQQQASGSRLRLISQAVMQAVVLNAQDDEDDFTDATSFQRSMEDGREDVVDDDNAVEVQQQCDDFTQAVALDGRDDTLD